MSSEQPQAVILVTGIQASGKSTIAQLLAERLPQSVHVRGDLFRRMIVNGRADMTPDPASEAVRQLRLRHQLAATVSDAYFLAGFTVIVQDVILGAHLVEMTAMIRSRPLLVIVLAPQINIIADREQGRGNSSLRHVGHHAARQHSPERDPAAWAMARYLRERSSAPGVHTGTRHHLARCQPVDLGPFEDAEPCRVSFLRRHALFAGTTGSGKSGGLNVLMATLAACDNVVIWAIDLKNGMELQPWAPCIDRLATTPRKPPRCSPTRSPSSRPAPRTSPRRAARLGTVARACPRWSSSSTSTPNSPTRHPTP